jgi:hypothetical protein
VFSSIQMANYREMENCIYLPELPPKMKGSPKRKRRDVPLLRRKWLDILKVICYPFFNENRPKSTGIIYGWIIWSHTWLMSFFTGSRLDYTDRVFLVAQWVVTHLFYDKQSILYQTVGVNGAYIREYRMKLHLNGSLLRFFLS